MEIGPFARPDATVSYNVYSDWSLESPDHLFSWRDDRRLVGRQPATRKKHKDVTNQRLYAGPHVPIRYSARRERARPQRMKGRLRTSRWRGTAIWRLPNGFATTSSSTSSFPFYSPGEANSGWVHCSDVPGRCRKDVQLGKARSPWSNRGAMPGPLAASVLSGGGRMAGTPGHRRLRRWHRAVPLSPREQA
jgi:hypothetical protein